MTSKTEDTYACMLLRAKIDLMITGGWRKGCNLPKSFHLILDGAWSSFGAVIVGIVTLLFPTLA